MARSRNLKPSFFSNDALAELSFETRLLFAGLWTIADRKGRLEDRPKKIKAELFPYDNVDCDKMLFDLFRNKFIIRYSVNGQNFIEINKFTKHQTPHHKEQESVIPDPPEGAENCNASYMPETSPRKGESLPCLNLNPLTLNPLTESLNLIPDSLIQELESEAIEKPELPTLENGWKNSPYKFNGKVMRITDKDFDEMRVKYAGTTEQFWDWMDNRDAWLNSLPPEKRKNWFIATHKALEKLK